MESKNLKIKITFNKNDGLKEKIQQNIIRKIDNLKSDIISILILLQLKQ